MAGQSAGTAGQLAERRAGSRNGGAVGSTSPHLQCRDTGGPGWKPLDGGPEWGGSAGLAEQLAWMAE